MASEENLPPVIKTMFFVVSMIPFAVADFESGKTGGVNFIYILDERTNN